MTFSQCTFCLPLLYTLWGKLVDCISSPFFVAHLSFTEHANRLLSFVALFIPAVVFLFPVLKSFVTFIHLTNSVRQLRNRIWRLRFLLQGFVIVHLKREGICTWYTISKINILESPQKEVMMNLNFYSSWDFCWDLTNIYMEEDGKNEEEFLWEKEFEYELKGKLCESYGQALWWRKYDPGCVEL